MISIDHACFLREPASRYDFTPSHIMFRLLLFLFAADATIAQNTTDPGYLHPRWEQSAMMTEITCRWSNCNEQCPIGFVSVPRKGGAEGELMVDGSRCNNNEFMRLCCPSNEVQPECRWRGISKTGNCKPGCHEEEVEVWSVRVGCKSGHQSACCTTSTASMEAYENCQWVGELPDCWLREGALHPKETCNKDFPIRIVEGSAGFGGQERCRTGTLQANSLYFSHGQCVHNFKKCIQK